MLSVNNTFLKNILLLLKPYKNKIFLLFFLVIITSLTAMISPIINSKIIDEGVVVGNLNVVIKYTLIVISLFLIDQMIEFIQIRQCSYINNMLSFDLVLKAFKHTIKLKLPYFQETNVSKIMSEVSQDTTVISSISEKNTLVSITQTLRIVGGIIGLFIINWKLTLFVLCFIPVKVIVTSLLSNKSQKTFKDLLDKNSKFSFWYGETLGGINEIKLWNLYPQKIKEFIGHQKEIIKIRLKSILIDQVNQTVEMTLQTLIFNFVYIISASMIIKADFTLGGMFSFVLYSSYVIQPLSLLINLYYQFSKVKPSMDRYIKFLDIEEESAENQEKLKINTQIFPEVIEFSNVYLRYREENAIDNLTFKIKRGEKVAIIGSNGSGKTSLVNLLLRFYSPNSGNIYMDNIDINNIDLEDYRELFAVMNQNVHLFNSTIEENIRMYREICDDNLIRSCIESDAIGFIDNLQDHFKTMVGFRGSKLSGGEKQKVALARVLAKEAPILVLDEATSNYDYESEQLITKVIKENTSHCFIIVISHRPDILKAVDKIIVMNKGNIVGQGSYTELYGHNELFTTMVDKSDEFKKNSDSNENNINESVLYDANKNQEETSDDGYTVVHIEYTPEC